MRYLLVPGNNSLSHITKCLAVKDSLYMRGHETFIAVSRKNSEFLKALGCEHFILPDIQENDDSGFPTFDWFRNFKRIEECIKDEVDLIKQLKPGRVLGVFRFTLKSSAEIAAVPYDSLICGCMLPDSGEVLGFDINEPLVEHQKMNLNTFFHYAGAKTSLALKSLGLDEIHDIRTALTGNRTFLWDFPEFMPVPKRDDYIHIGPIDLKHWPVEVNTGKLLDAGRPLAVITFGTCTNNAGILERIARLLLESGYRVMIAAGGQRNHLDILPNESLVTRNMFAPLRQILPETSLLVCHGGQMTVFESLYNEVPVMVMPFQPEQAHNGICLERIGCGSRFVPSRPFRGDPEVYITEFNTMSDNEILHRIEKLVNNPPDAKIIERNKSKNGLISRCGHIGVNFRRSVKCLSALLWFTGIQVPLMTLSH